MEIFRQSINRVYFEAPETTSVVSATVSLNEGTPVVISPVVGNGSSTTQRYIDIPFIGEEGSVCVEWSWTGSQLTPTGLSSNVPVSQKDTYDVVTPILSEGELRAVLDDATDEELIVIEKAVRHVINSHTGQTFGLSVGPKVAIGTGESSLTLPDRLIKLNAFGVEGAANKLYDRTVYPDGRPEYFLGNGIYDIAGGGWYINLLRNGNADMGIKNDHSDFVSMNGVIYSPKYMGRGFADDIRYVVDGEWGYREVPEAVKEAAKLLVNDYASYDSTYRDRYLESLTSPDWRIQFHSGAFRQTGNVRADQLLSAYVLKRGWAVI